MFATALLINLCVFVLMLRIGQIRYAFLETAKRKSAEKPGLNINSRGFSATREISWLDLVNNGALLTAPG
jgi:hypothetical protein